MTNPDTVKLISFDQQKLFEVDRSLAERSKVVCEILDGIGPTETIPLDNISTTVLGRIIAIEEMLMKNEGDGGFADKKHRKQIVKDIITGFVRDSNTTCISREPEHDDTRKRHRLTDVTEGAEGSSLSSTEEYEKDVYIQMLADVLTAANYLNSERLLDTMCEIMVDLIKDAKGPEEIRKMFRIKSDFTAEEVEEIKRENSWAFD